MRYATLKLIMSFGPCYTQEQVIAAMGGKKRLTPRQYAALDIPPKDRLWGMFRVWPEFVGPTLDLAIERAIRRNLGKSGCPEWEKWAEKWLDGTDRSRAATHAAYADAAADTADARAADTAYAAYAAARAADTADAAYAARAAARAADAACAARAAAYAAEFEQIITDFVAIAEGD